MMVVIMMCLLLIVNDGQVVNVAMIMIVNCSAHDAPSITDGPFDSLTAALPNGSLIMCVFLMGNKLVVPS